MPKIFSEADKNAIQERLMETGLACLEKKGYKASSVEEITRSAGIAKGTFYNFFPSKEHFYLQIMLSIRDKRRRELLDFFTSAEKPGRKKMEEFLLCYVQKKNVHHYFTGEELALIFRKIPEERDKISRDSAAFAAELFENLPKVNPRLNRQVAVNYLNLMADFAAGLRRQPVEGVQETLEFMARTLSAYILGKDKI